VALSRCLSPQLLDVASYVSTGRLKNRGLNLLRATSRMNGGKNCCRWRCRSKSVVQQNARAWKIGTSRYRDTGTSELQGCFLQAIAYQFSRHSRPHRRYRLSKTCACRLESLGTQPLFPVLRQEGRSSRVCCRNDADFFVGCRKPVVRAVIRQPRPAFDCPRNATLFASVRGRFRSAERALPTCTI